MDLLISSILNNNNNNNMNTDTTEGSSLTCRKQNEGASSEEYTGQNMDKGQREIETSNPYVPWNNFQLEKNSTAGIVSETS